MDGTKIIDTFEMYLQLDVKNIKAKMFCMDGIIGAHPDKIRAPRIA